MKTLVMLSGGLDSTYALVKLLRETDDEVITHHIHLITPTGRHEMEAIACKNIVQYCRDKYRDFFYSESTIDRRRMLGQGYDILSAAMEAGVVATSYHIATDDRIDRWLIGRCLEEIVPGARRNLAKSICAGTCSGIVEAPEWYRTERVSQQAQVDYLPSELFQMTWSCRIPSTTNSTTRPCGKCRTCKRLGKLRIP